MEFGKHKNSSKYEVTTALGFRFLVFHPSTLLGCLSYYQVTNSMNRPRYLPPSLLLLLLSCCFLRPYSAAAVAVAVVVGENVLWAQALPKLTRCVRTHSKPRRKSRTSCHDVNVHLLPFSRRQCRRQHSTNGSVTSRVLRCSKKRRYFAKGGILYATGAEIVPRWPGIL